MGDKVDFEAIIRKLAADADLEMEDFRGKPLDGEWWAADRPTGHYKGVLLLDEKHHGTLTLRGTEDQLASLPIDPVQQTFFGRLENNPFKVSLFNVGCRRGPSRAKKPDQQTDAEFFTNHILIGGYFESEEKPFLNGALLHLAGLDLEEWCDATGFSGKLEQVTPELAIETVNVSFQASASPHYDLGGGRSLRFLSQYRGPLVFGLKKSMTLAERNTIELAFSEAISITEVLDEISIWQSFITFGLRRPSYIDELTLLIPSGGERFTPMGLIVPGRKTEPPVVRRDPWQVLFNRSKLGPNIASYLKAWRQKQDNIEIAVLLFSGAAYQDPVYIHTNLLTYLQALEILYRQFVKRDRFPDPATKKATIEALRAAVPTTLSETLQKEIREQLGNTIGNLPLLDRLKQLFSLYPKSLTPLFRGGDRDMMLLKDTRNFLTHYGDQKFDKEFLSSREIIVVKEKARLFLEICLLGAIGMSDDEIFRLVKRFEPWLEASSETSRF